MEEKPEPKFEVGQVVMLKGKKEVPFKIIRRQCESDGWYYAWNRNNYASEDMIRGLTALEAGSL